MVCGGLEMLGLRLSASGPGVAAEMHRHPRGEDAGGIGKLSILRGAWRSGMSCSPAGRRRNLTETAKAVWIGSIRPALHQVVLDCAKKVLALLSDRL